MKFECFQIKHYYILVSVLACSLEGIYALEGVSKTISIPLRKYRDAQTSKGKRDLSEYSEDSVSPKYHDNLSGRPGQGYYLAIELGTPPQAVSIRKNFRILQGLKFHVCSLGLSELALFEHFTGTFRRGNQTIIRTSELIQNMLSLNKPL